MPRVIYYTACTLTGHLATEHNSLDWLLSIPQDDAVAGIDDFTRGMGVMVEGSATYEWVVRQGGLVEQPSLWQEWYGDRPTFVFTTREQVVIPGADVRFRSGSVASAWPEIVAAAGDRDVWLVGGGDLVGQFLDAGHLDEIVITYAPATLAGGKPLLPRDLGADRLTLTKVRQVGAFAELTYTVR